VAISLSLVETEQSGTGSVHTYDSIAYGEGVDKLGGELLAVGTINGELRRLVFKVSPIMEGKSLSTSRQLLCSPLHVDFSDDA
jgi:hypothetical protein